FFLSLPASEIKNRTGVRQTENDGKSRLHNNKCLRYDNNENKPPSVIPRFIFQTFSSTAPQQTRQEAA
ncbi:hypothetical protein, partial [Escherichia coli]|uniref:hypothetical protein n=1 Tax=Escherichia coli TaxID=562 RepID=UPI001BC84EC8